jgi:hypothetical protein
MKKNLARVAAVTVLIAGSIVACGNGTPACAATSGKPAPKPYRPSKPSGQRTTSKVQDKPRIGTSRKPTTNPYWKSSTKPTTWGGYNTGRNWQQPYRKGMPPAPQPVIVHVHNHDYRTYPGYAGYYPVGIWPIGYGQRYGCSAEKEAAPESTPSPAPTVTVTTTVPPSVEPSATPSN